MIDLYVCEILRRCAPQDDTLTGEHPRMTHSPRNIRRITYKVIEGVIFSETEPVKSLSELDVKRYGVIVTKGWRRGLLLPNLDGVDSVAQQIAIAKQKAGIGEDEEGVELERFEVVRHF